MPYVQRDAHGLIRSLHLEAGPDHGEWLAADAPELLAFLATAAPGADTAPAPREAYAALDADFVRVLEDLVDVLIGRGIIRITDLPSEAQTKLFARKSFRDRVNQNSLRLFEPGDAGSLPISFDPLQR